MAAARKIPPDLLTDSEATLRLVQDLLEELEETESEDGTRQAAGILDQVGRLMDSNPGLPPLFVRVYAEMQRILFAIRERRMALEHAARDRLQHTNEKLQEVSSATEVAATSMLDAVDRSLGLVDEIERGGGGPAAFTNLKEELHGLVVLLQFQDITSQQLEYASATITDMEDKVGMLADLFESAVLGAKTEAPRMEEAASVPTYDPHASVEGAANRQAIADDVFAR